MPSVLITGSNRGIGLEWVRQLAAAGWRVHATCRHPAEAEELNALAADNSEVSVHRLDVTSVDDLRAIRLELRESTIDLLLNNAGIYLEKGGPTLGSFRYDDWRHTFDVNTLGAVRVTETLIEQVARSERPLVVVTTSHMGSIDDIVAPGSYYYRSSKAALNAAFKGIAAELEPRGIPVILLHPGAVRTRMGGSESRLTVKESVEAMRQVVDGIGPGQTGCFYRYDGSQLPW